MGVSELLWSARELEGGGTSVFQPHNVDLAFLDTCSPDPEWPYFIHIHKPGM